MARVVVYTSSTCSACEAVKEFLAQNNIEFEEKRLEDSRWAEELSEHIGTCTAPTVIIDGVLVSGSLEALATALHLPF